MHIISSFILLQLLFASIVLPTKQDYNTPLEEDPFPEGKYIKDIEENTQCFVCRNSWQLLRTMTLDPFLLHNLGDYIGEQCKRLGKYEESCITLTKNYILPSVVYFMANTEPEDFCSDIGLCHAVEIDQIKLMGVGNVHKYPGQPSAQAEVCKDLKYALLNLIHSKKFQYDVIRLSDSFCQRLESESKLGSQICLDFSHNLFPVWLKKIGNYMSEQDPCRYLKEFGRRIGGEIE
ncbi:hypothetical protein P9112_003586 [Eukaryota sp. TZLM1-RC]